MDRHLQRLHDEIADVLCGTAAAQLTSHPEGKWCAAEVLEHLYLTYHGTLKGCERSLHDGKPLAHRPNLQERLRTTVVVTLGYMPPGRKAPEPSNPRGMPAENVVKAIVSELVAMDKAITLCEERFGKGARFLNHPILGPLTAHQWRKFHYVHGRHHLKQISRLRQQGAVEVKLERKPPAAPEA